MSNKRISRRWHLISDMSQVRGQILIRVERHCRQKEQQEQRP